MKNLILAAAATLVAGHAVYAQDPVAPAGAVPLPPPTLIPTMPNELVVIRPVTVNEFVAGFKPIPGHHKVLLIHPRTQCPVEVCFTLPPGCPKRVRYRCHELEFDYGRREVEIQFRRDGRVTVDYD